MSNKMKELAGIFGLEIGEEFNIVNDWRYSEYNPYVFTEEGLIDKDGDVTPIPTNLLQGLYTIEKIPFRPKKGERYFTCDSNLTVHNFEWSGCGFDLEHQLLDIVFRTEQEAIDYLPIYEKRLKG